MTLYQRMLKTLFISSTALALSLGAGKKADAQVPIIYSQIPLNYFCSPITQFGAYYSLMPIRAISAVPYQVPVIPYSGIPTGYLAIGAQKTVNVNVNVDAPHGTLRRGRKQPEKCDLCDEVATLKKQQEESRIREEEILRRLEELNKQPAAPTPPPATPAPTGPQAPETFPYEVEYSGRVCDDQIDNVITGIYNHIFAVAKIGSDGKLNYKAYDNLDNRIIGIRRGEGQTQPVFRLDANKYKGRNIQAPALVTGALQDLRNSQLIGADDYNTLMEAIPLTYRNFSCGGPAPGRRLQQQQQPGKTLAPPK